MDKLQAMATALAASIPPHLDRPTIPPISWAQVGDQVSVILADGRKVSASIQAVNELMFSQNLAQAPAPAKVRPEKPTTTPHKGNVKK